MNWEIILLFAAPVICSLPIAFYWVKDPGSEKARKLPYLSVFGLFVSFVIAIHILLTYPNGTYTIPWLPEYNINFVFIFDYLSKYMGALTAFIAFMIGLYGLEYMKHDYRLGWYWFFFNMFTASMLLVVYSDNLLMLLIGWEGLGLASWGLIGHWFRDDDEISYVGIVGRKVGPLKMYWPPSYGGWRAISTIRTGDMPMFFAVAAIYALTGNLNISQIHWGALFAKIGFAGTLFLMLCFLMGPFTKSAQLPFSEWLMTAMTGPTTVSALLHSATMVAAGTYLFIRMSWYIHPWALHSVPGVGTLYLVVLLLGLFSALYGASVAIGCLERKVLLAASTMSSLGLMFGCAAASYWFGKLAVVIAFWYLMTHAFAKATLFLVAGHLIHATHDRFCCGDLNLAKKMKTAFIATIVATIALGGLPPLTAYWVKAGMDTVMHHIVEMVGSLPLDLLIVTSLLYSAFLAKFLSLNFWKGDKYHLHLHGEKLMPFAYACVVSMVFLLLYRIITGTDPLAETHLLEFGLEKDSFIVGLGVTATYLFALVVPRIRALSPVGTFLGDRMYLPALNDFIVPSIGWAISKLIEYTHRAIDWFCHFGLPDAMLAISKRIRAIQVGYMRVYMKIALAFVMAAIVVSMLGWL